MTAPVTPLIGDLGTPELLIILAVVILLFGSSKLPELARGSGRALRIFKAETKGLMDEDDDAKPSAASATAPATTTTPPVVPAPTAAPPLAAGPTAPITNAAELEARRRELVALQAELDAEAARLRGQSPTA